MPVVQPSVVRSAWTKVTRESAPIMILATSRFFDEPSTAVMYRAGLGGSRDCRAVNSPVPQPMSRILIVSPCNIWRMSSSTSSKQDARPPQ